MHDQRVGLAVAFERLVTLPPAAALDDVNQIRPTFEKFGRAAVAQAMRGMVRDAEQPLRGREKRAKIGTDSEKTYSAPTAVRRWQKSRSQVANQLLSIVTPWSLPVLTDSPRVRSPKTSATLRVPEELQLSKT